MKINETYGNTKKKQPGILEKRLNPGKEIELKIKFKDSSLTKTTGITSPGWSLGRYHSDESE